MNLADVLVLVREAGLTLRTEGDELYASPRANLSEPLRNLVRAFRPELLDYLKNGAEYAPADLEEMDRLLHELAEQEGWTPAALEGMLDQRRWMAPARVMECLQQLREACAEPPEKPRVKPVLCLLDAGLAETK
jgi:hypothetical protein